MQYCFYLRNVRGEELERRVGCTILRVVAGDPSKTAELLGTFEQAVLLAIWRLSEEAYGRAILRGVQSVLDRQVAAGAVYATLDRLEQKKFIGSHTEQGTAVRAGRARRYYRLTAPGIKALNESKSALEQMWRAAQWPLESKA